MPVSVATTRDPFRGVAAPGRPTVGRPAPTGLRLPQARVLRALVPAYPDDPPGEWPIYTRAVLAMRAGYTALSGSVTRALNGIHPGSSSGDPHLGLLALGLVEMIEIDVEGTLETNYRATHAGIHAYQRFIADGGTLPPVKDAAICTNSRYTKD